MKSDFRIRSTDQKEIRYCTPLKSLVTQRSSVVLTAVNISKKKRPLKIKGLIMVFDAILTSRQTRLGITFFVWKSDVK